MKVHMKRNADDGSAWDVIDEHGRRVLVAQGYGLVGQVVYALNNNTLRGCGTEAGEIVRSIRRADAGQPDDRTRTRMLDLAPRYRSIYIRQDRIKAEHPRPIIVDDREGTVLFCASLTCHGPSKLVYSPKHETGESCLWFETESALTLTNPEIEHAD